MFAACAKTETEDVIPVNPEPEDEAQTVYVEIGATTGSDTKATYDKDLNAYWEAGDQILAVQGHACNWVAGGNKDTVKARELNILSGELTNSAIFKGTITTQSNDAKYFHFAYPTTNTELYTYGEIGAFGTNNSQTTTCTYTVPAEQDGKWTPFLCTSTTEKTTAANITNIEFGESRNACFAVRVYGSDKTTPKKIKSITITAENNIIGTLSATTENDASFANKTFGISGGGNTITADNLQNIEPLNGIYEYRFEVLPSEPNTNSGKITLTITDESGSVITRQASAKAFNANICSGVKVYWDAAGISMDATTWFEDSCAKNELSALSSANTIYCNVTLFGIGADDIKEKGVLVNGTEDYKNNDSSHKFSSEIAATNGNGEYTVQAYAILNDGTELKTDEKIVYIVDEKVLPAITSHTIRSSYNNNGIVDKTNDFNGNLIKANVSLNDCWASNNLVESVTLVYDGLTEAMTVGTELEKSVDSRAYKNTHIDVKFSNGHHIYTPKYEINVTGIPYNINFDSTSPAGWEVNNLKKNPGIYLSATTGYCLSPKFYVPQDLNVSVSVPVYAYCASTFGLEKRYKPSVYVSASNTAVASGNATNLTGGNDLSPSQSSFTNINPTLNFTNSVNRVCIYATGKGYGGAVVNGVMLNYCKIEYAK